MRFLLPIALGVLAASCGDDGAKGGDKLDAAIVGDGAPGGADAPTDGPPAPTPVTLSLTRAGSNVGSAQVYFQNSDSSLVASTTTDGSGNASAVMVTGGFVTAIVTGAAPALTGTPSAPTANAQLYTFGAVHAGDHLHLDLQTGAMTQQVSVTVPLATGSGAPIFYQLHSTCDINPAGTFLTVGATTATGTASLVSGCTTGDFAVYGTGGATTRIATATNVPITANLDLSTTLSAYGGTTPVAITLTDVPAGVSVISVQQNLETARGLLSSGQAGPIFPSAGTGSATFQLLSLPASKAITLTYLQQASNTWGELQTAEVTAPASTYSLDVGANVLHVYTSSPVFDIAAHHITWTEGAAGEDPDLMTANLEIDGTATLWNWHIAVPRTGTTVTLPVLPGAPIDYNAAAGDTVTVRALDALKVPGGYDLVRTHVFADVDPSTLFTAGKAAHEDLHAPPQGPSLHAASIARDAARSFGARAFHVLP